MVQFNAKFFHCQFIIAIEFITILALLQ